MLCNAIIASFLGLCCTLVKADGIYTKSSPVLQVSSKDFTSLIEQTNHTSIVEFYAPWCGHCQNLKPAYEKAAKSLSGLAKVAAINCDEEANKPLCGRMGVQGFPTLKIFKPGTKKGKPIVEDYQGARTAKAIVDAVSDKIPNHVTKIQDAGVDAWLARGENAKAILFSEKGTTGSLIKALAIDFLGSIDFAQIRNKEKDTVEKFGINKFPSIVLIPTSGKDPLTFNGEMKKDALITFFSQVASPNADPAPKKAKTSSKKVKDNSASATASSKFSEASEAHKASDLYEDLEELTIELNENMPTASPLPIVEHDQKPAVMKEPAPAISELGSIAELESACLTPKSGNCILVLLPTKASVDAEIHPLAAEVLASFAEVAEKHHKRGTHIFPFFSVPATNEAGVALRQGLGLKSAAELEVIAINMKRKWWRTYSATGYDIADAETFVDAIRLGEGAKQKLPADFYSIKDSDTSEPATPQAEPEPEPVSEDTLSADSATAAPEPAPTAEAPVHNEL